MRNQTKRTLDPSTAKLRSDVLDRTAAKMLEAVKAEHTPTPWKVQMVKEWGQEVEYPQVVTPDGIICNGLSLIPGFSREANAAFIVRAVNSHDALLEALTNVMGWYDSSAVAQAMSKIGEQAHYHATINAAHAAIRNATNH